MTRASIARRLRGERGQVATEFMGWIFWVLLAAMAAWQLLLAGWTAIEASNSARTASRVIARDDGDPKRAARNSLPKPLRKGVKVKVDGDRVTVRVPLPILIPSFASMENVRMKGEAELPS